MVKQLTPSMSGYKIAVDKSLFTTGCFPAGAVPAPHAAITFVDVKKDALTDFTLIFLADRDVAYEIAYCKGGYANPAILVTRPTSSEEEFKLAKFIFTYACTSDDLDFADGEVDNDPLEDGREMLKMFTVPCLSLERYL